MFQANPVLGYLTNQDKNAEIEQRRCSFQTSVKMPCDGNALLIKMVMLLLLFPRYPGTIFETLVMLMLIA